MYNMVASIQILLVKISKAVLLSVSTALTRNKEIFDCFIVYAEQIRLGFFFFLRSLLSEGEEDTKH